MLINYPTITIKKESVLGLIKQKGCWWIYKKKIKNDFWKETFLFLFVVGDEKLIFPIENKPKLYLNPI